MSKIAPTQAVYGIDFSGARQAGRSIWIAAATVSHGKLMLDSVAPATESLSVGTDRDAVLPRLVQFISELGDTVVGCDFPFSLPSRLLRGERWRDFITRLADRYPSAEEFRSWCRRAGGEHELKRECDTVARTPMSAYNLRIYRQTYYGIRDVLAPLAEADSARIPPMQSTATGKPTVIEVCPASLLKRLGLPSSLYKGWSPSHRKNRALILDGVVEIGQLAPPNSTLRRRLLNDPGGDALDSVLAAVGAYRAATSAAGLYDPVPASLIDEGWVYT